VVARFSAERQALALMDHPNIAKVLDAGETDAGRPYFVMELVRGIPITEYCDQARLTIRQRLAVFVQVCRAIQHAHTKGVIHRDLKPSNVLVTSNDGVPVPVVIDFGVAKALGQQLTERNIHTGFAQMVGTPLYMSPEQAEFNQLGVDTRSDVYSLGVLLYELLTGVTPFDSERLKTAGYDEFRRILREEEPPRLSVRLSTLEKTLSTASERRGVDARKLTQTLHGELDWIVLKSLEKDRNRRYESASAFAADVQRYLNDEQVEACPPSTGYRLRKFARRNRSRLALAAVLFVSCLFAVGSLAAVQLQNTNRLREVAQSIRQSFTVARTAIKAADLTLATQQLAEAQGRLSNDRAKLPELAEEYDRLHQEIEARRADEDRFQRFLKLSSEGQDSMYGSIGRREDRVAEKSLELYAVLTADDWLSPLEDSYLAAEKKQQVREVAYVTLVSMADESVRWKADPKSVQRSLDLLNRAQSFHEPTRAFYFVRGICHSSQGETAAADEDNKRFKQMEGRTAWDYFLPGHTAGWAGDLDEAIRSYQAALRIQPNHYNSLYFMADRFATDKINRRPEAIQLFTACIALRPDHVWPYLDRAECHEKLKQMAEAEADLTAAFSLDSEDTPISEAFKRRREFWERQGDVEKSRKVLEAETAQIKTFIERNPRDAPAHHRLGNILEETGPLDGTIACWRKVTELDPTSCIGHNNLGVLLDKTGRVEEAIACYRKAIELNPVYSLAHTNLGACLGKNGRVDEAIACYRKAIETDAKNVRAYVELSYELRDKGLTDEVIACCRKAIELDPKNEQAHYGLGLALYKKGLPDEAIPIWRKAIEINPKSVLAHCELGTALHEMARRTGEKGLLDEAIASYRKAIEINPKADVAQYDIGVALEQKGLWDEAIACYRRAMDLQPKDPDYIQHLAGLLANCPDLKYRDPNQAMSLARKGMELAPENANSWLILGAAHYRLGEFKAALEALDKGMALSEKLAPSRKPYSSLFMLAMTHWQLGDKDLALSWFRNGVERMESKDSTRRNEPLLISIRAETAALLQIPDDQPKAPNVK
jgi:tetratricopeptide (TPR) repeat protein